MSTKILETHQIPISTTSPPLPLTFFDVPWLPTGPIQRLLFYPHPNPHSTLPSLLHSLSQSLHLFPHLSGTSTSSHLTPSPSVPFVVVENSLDQFPVLSSPPPRPLSLLPSLIPQLPSPLETGEFPVFAAQLTLFPNHGLALGLAIHHVACDDSSFLHFLNSWAHICAGKPHDVPPPILDRSLIIDPDGLCNKILAEFDALRSSGPPPVPLDDHKDEEFFASFVIGRREIGRLKEAAEKSGGRHVSSFVVACAFAWVCLVKARGSVYEGIDTAHLVFSVDCRRRLEPPVSAEYFGNCLRPCFVEVPMGVLVGDGGVLAAALAVGNSIKGLEDGVLEGAEGWLSKIISLGPMRPMSIAGSPRFKVYDIDFGWGNPVQVDMTSIEKTPGTISLAESRDGDGIEIGGVLPKMEMDEFRSVFRNGLLQL